MPAISEIPALRQKRRRTAGDRAKGVTDDPVVADIRNFYKVELWTRDDHIEPMLFAGTSLDKARTVFAD